MMRSRRHQFMCLSQQDHLLGKQQCVRVRDVLHDATVCCVVWWIVLPLHKAICGSVYSPLYCLCPAKATDGHKDTKTHSFSSSQLVTQLRKGFSSLCIFSILDYFSFCFLILNESFFFCLLEYLFAKKKKKLLSS